MECASMITDIASKLKNKGGTLVFVPNYAMANILLTYIPKAISEPKEGDIKVFKKDINSFKLKIDQKIQSIFICVFRAKLQKVLILLINWPD
jgi:hypothetical protein